MKGLRRAAARGLRILRLNGTGFIISAFLSELSSLGLLFSSHGYLLCINTQDAPFFRTGDGERFLPWLVVSAVAGSIAVGRGYRVLSILDLGWCGGRLGASSPA